MTAPGFMAFGCLYGVLGVPSKLISLPWRFLRVQVPAGAVCGRASLYACGGGGIQTEVADSMLALGGVCGWELPV